ncbi:hypothetical protein [Halococcus agarilyticus]|uniref:hypothetical protein n=1 Tax=Halococcus agarilyticus TaxID=1232219 RepID=UPI0009AE87F0|nr:hypothetical protein [Halococcus agarilyticus]
MRAVDGGASYYRVYVPGSIDLGEEADRPDEADHADRVISQTTTYIQGYVGEGGVDDYVTDVGLGVIVNDGNATLEVYLNGELYDTVEPGENAGRYGPLGPPDLPPPNASQKVIRVEAVGDGDATYFLGATERITLGDEADVPAEADRPDRNSPISWRKIYGYVGDGGVDTYRTTGDVVSIDNDGSARLRVYVDDELWTTVGPNETVEREGSEAT